MPSFQFPALLWLLVVLLLPAFLYVYALRQKKATAARIGEPRLVGMLLRGYSRAAYRNKFLLVLISMTLLILALANPRKAGGTQAAQRQGIDLMIALDVSKSMLARDISPSRLDRAKQFLAQLVDQLGENRVGLVLFAGRAYLQMPLTSDLTAARMYIGIASPDNVPTQGTVISEALARCNGAFSSQEKKYKAIVLVSDGEDHDESAVKTARELASQGVIIHSIGIGSPGGSPLFDETTNDYKKDNEGNTIISKLNESSLKEIAEAGNGTYQLYGQSPGLVSSILDQLAGMDQRSIRDDAQTDYFYFFPFLLAMAILLLMIEPFIREKSARRLSAGPVTFFVSTAFLLLTACTASAQEAPALIKKGNQAYRSGEFTAARDQYQSALNLKPDYAPARFNLGNALYKSGEKEKALKEYESSIEGLSDPAEKSNAWYNRGVILQGDKKLPECIDAYKRALKLDPSNQDARINLQQALKEQQKQQEKEKQKQEEEKKKKQDQDKKEQNPNKQDKQQQQEKQPPPKLSKQEAENRLKALLQQEKSLQDKLHKANQAISNKPEKDW